MKELFLIAVLPFLTEQNLREVKEVSDTSKVYVLFTMDNCGPCEDVKLQYSNRTDLYVINSTRQPALFPRLAKGRVTRFPTLGLWYKGMMYYYPSGSSTVRKVLR